MMKKAFVWTVVLAMLFMSACGKATEKESEKQTGQEVTETEEVIGPESETDSETDTEMTTETTHIFTNVESEYPGTYYIKTNVEEYQDYLADEYTFSEDGTRGHFVLETIDSYSKEYVDSLRTGDKLAHDITIEELERYDDYESIRINEGMCYLNLQENGSYYLFGPYGFADTMPAGEKDFAVSRDVIILDNVTPFGVNGITVNEQSVEAYGSVAEFIDILDDGVAAYTPNILIRVVEDEVVLIVINPWQHQPWKNTYFS